jgi:anthranilate phosphoribosyltransferase
LNGQAGPERDIVLVNSAAALLVSGLADSPLAAMERAAQSIDSGAARLKLEKLAEFSRSWPAD